MKSDIRWKQRFSNYKLALNQLNEGVSEYNIRKLSNLEKQGLIKAFEFTNEIAWNLMKDYMEYQGNFDLKGPRDAIREFNKSNLLNDGNIWMKMLETRNLTSHTYDNVLIESILKMICNTFIFEFNHLKNTMEILGNENE